VNGFTGMCVWAPETSLERGRTGKQFDGVTSGLRPCPSGRYQSFCTSSPRHEVEEWAGQLRVRGAGPHGDAVGAHRGEIHGKHQVEVAHARARDLDEPVVVGMQKASDTVRARIRRGARTKPVQTAARCRSPP